MAEANSRAVMEAAYHSFLNYENLAGILKSNPFVGKAFLIVGKDRAKYL